MQTPSHTLLGIQPDKKSSDQFQLSAIGKAFAKADLNEVHEILQDDGYNEDDMANAEVKELYVNKHFIPKGAFLLQHYCTLIFQLVSYQLCKMNVGAST